MRKIATLLALLLLVPLQPLHAATKAGAPCTVIGKSVTEQNKTFVCTKSGSKKIWKLQSIDQLIASDVLKAEKNMEPQKYKDFLVNKLQSKHNYSVDDAKEMVDALMNGYKKKLFDLSTDDLYVPSSLHFT